jgi:glycosyltransferase involved in cell wall biosynthesis
VVANAAAVAHDARVVERLPARKLSVIYNGLPPSAFTLAPPEDVGTALPAVLCVARLVPAKGHRVLIDAAALLRGRGRPCTVVLAGDGPERDQLEEAARGRDVDVRFLGSRADVRGLLAGADVVVLPSITEGLSNAVMEAMAAARPIVATAVGGTPELLEDRGLLVPAADPEALAAAIDRLLGDREQATALGNAARAWALTNLDVGAMADEHIALYDRLLRDRGHAGRSARDEIYV